MIIFPYSFFFFFCEHVLWRESFLSKDILDLFLNSVCIVVVPISWLKYLAYFPMNTYICIIGTLSLDLENFGDCILNLPSPTAMWWQNLGQFSLCFVPHFLTWWGNAWCLTWQFWEGKCPLPSFKPLMSSLGRTDWSFRCLSVAMMVCCRACLKESVARSAESACLLWYLKETLEKVAAGKAVSSRIFWALFWW